MDTIPLLDFLKSKACVSIREVIECHNKNPHSLLSMYDFKLLLSDILSVNFSYLISHDDENLTTKQQNKLAQYLKRRLNQEPIAYILGSWEFYGLRFKVNKNVLIPRPDTELLVDRAIELLKNRVKSSLQEQQTVRILEIGSGSGCIAITLKKHFPEIYLESWDISDNALKIANENASIHNTDIVFLQKDALNHQSWEHLEPFDLIVSNPPYIAEESYELRQMSDECKLYEPRLALFAEEEGLEFYHAAKQFALDKIKSGGTLLMEIGWKQGPAVLKIFSASKNIKNCDIHQDLAGKDRLLELQFKK